MIGSGYRVALNLLFVDIDFAHKICGLMRELFVIFSHSDHIVLRQGKLFRGADQVLSVHADLPEPSLGAMQE